MALTMLDANTALIVIDLQKGIVRSPFADSMGRVVERSRALLDAFRVTLGLDAMTDPRPEAHDHSIRNVFPKLGETGTAREIIDLLAARSA